MTNQPLPDESYDDLNDSELRWLCEQAGRKPPLWTPREVLLHFLEDPVTRELPEDPMVEVRIHQVSAIIDRLDTLRAQMPQPLLGGGKCDGCCFDHDDMRVMECQVQNPSFRLPTYPNSR